ncbi:J domain-containing protein [Lachnospiraceae bacterium C1.1]|nr:J domain-containing protein [Lachnospiraceae bacterium C1.1]
MNDLILTDNKNDEKYDEYSELLCRRDQLNKECVSILIAYTREFRDLITKNFELKVECIKKKKMITFCQKQLNGGDSIDADLMSAQIDIEMQDYYLRLRDLMEENDAAKSAEKVDGFRIERTKKIYRRLAKKLHPDINSKTMIYERPRELWERIVTAYQKSDVDELEDLEALTRIALDEMGDDGFEIAVTDIDERIARIERQIGEIITTEPYIYRELLCDEEKVTAKKQELEAECREYQDYLNELTGVLESLLTDGGASVLWTMN